MAKMFRIGAAIAAALFTATLTSCSAGSPATADHAAAAAGDVQAAPTATTAKCDAAVMVNVDHDAYDRKSVNLNMGDTLLVMNKTMNTFTLDTKPDDGLRYMVLDPMEMEHVPFNKAGTYTLSSREHPDTALSVTVSSTANYTCGEKPVSTVQVSANGAFSQQNVNVPQGQSILVANNSGQDLEVMSSPDLGMGMGDQLYHAGEQQTLYFPDARTYVFTSKQHPDQKMTVVVAKGDGGDN